MISNLEKLIPFSPLPTPIAKSIKITSLILITGAIFWELANLDSRISHWTISHNLDFIFWIDRIILVAHFFEALFAAYYLSLQGKNPIKHSIYTFFVGTVGLVELKTEKLG